jgi:hypothetical protein
MTPEKMAYALQLLAEPDRSISSIAKLLGVSRSTLYKALPELVPPQLAGPGWPRRSLGCPPTAGRCPRCGSTTSC